MHLSQEISFEIVIEINSYKNLFELCKSFELINFVNISSH